MSNLQNTLPTESAPAGGRALRCASSGPTSRNRGAVGAGIVVIVLILRALLAPHSPVEQYRDFVKIPPAWLEGGNWKFILGTDEAATFFRG